MHNGAVRFVVEQGAADYLGNPIRESGVRAARLRARPAAPTPARVADAPPPRKREGGRRPRYARAAAPRARGRVARDGGERRRPRAARRASPPSHGALPRAGGAPAAPAVAPTARAVRTRGGRARARERGARLVEAAIFTTAAAELIRQRRREERILEGDDDQPPGRRRRHADIAARAPCTPTPTPSPPRGPRRRSATSRSRPSSSSPTGHLAGDRAARVGWRRGDARGLAVGRRGYPFQRSLIRARYQELRRPYRAQPPTAADAAADGDDAAPARRAPVRRRRLAHR